MDSLMLSSRFSQPARPTKRSDYEPLPLRWKVVVDMHLAGSKVKEICARTGYAPPTVYHILNSERALRAKQFLLEHTQEEFTALFERVVDVISEKLKDPEKALEAANLWLKANGKFKESTKSTFHISAEDIVMQIMNQPE